MGILDKLQNLDQLQKIVTDEGLPTIYFIRFIQNRLNALIDVDALLAEIISQVDAIAAVDIIAGTALDGGGNIGAGVDITIDHADEFVGTPGTFGDATHVGSFTVDARGHVVAASNVAITGGGGHTYEGFGDLASIAALTKLAGASANITLTDGTKAHLYSWTSSGANQVQLADSASPSTPWSAYLRLQANTLANNVQFGLIARNSANAKFALFSISGSGGFVLNVQEWTNPTTFSSTLLTTAFPAVAYRPTWLRIDNDGTTLTFYYSINGVDWVNFGTRTIATFLGGIDRLGLGGVPQTASLAWVSDFGFVTPT